MRKSDGSGRIGKLCEPSGFMGRASAGGDKVPSGNRRMGIKGMGFREMGIRQTGIKRTGVRRTGGIKDMGVRRTGGIKEMGVRRMGFRGMGFIGFIRFIGFFSLLFMGLGGVAGCQEWLDELGVGDKANEETDNEKKSVAGKSKGNPGAGNKRRKKREKRGSRKRRRRSKSRKSRWKKSPQALVMPNTWGKVVHVVDADTVYLEMEDTNKTFVKARLVGIDAPECNKSRTRIAGGRSSAHCSSDDDFFGMESYRMMKKFVMNKRVQVRCETTDNGFCKCGTYGRPLLSIELDGKDIGEVLLERGGGLAFTKYNAPNMARYCRAEDRGRKTKRGMWKHGTREDVMSKMSKKTRRWYKNRDKKCRRAMQQAKK